MGSSTSVASASALPPPRSITPQPAQDTRTILLDVPFSPQAPYAIWDPVHEEACEEMSLIMVHHFLAGTPLTPEDAEGELLALIAWLERNGLPHDIDIATLARVATEYYGYTATVRTGEDVTEDAIRDALASGSPIIIPAQGQELGNPYFSGDGPPYHMLVITGIDGDAFVTNDPGTKRGRGYRYDTHVLLDAIHDWNGSKETVAAAPRAMLVLHP